MFEGGESGVLVWLREFSWDNRGGGYTQRQTKRGKEKGTLERAEGQETETKRVRDGKRWTQADRQEKLRARVGAGLELGALGRGAELGAARKGSFQKGPQVRQRDEEAPEP